jgi:pyridinium-3,5-biscarboxylic acid mononucleotide sulfurtransferase
MGKDWNSMGISAVLSEKSAKLHDILASFGRLAVAYSGGVDSSLLLAAAVDALGADRVAAFTALSELTPDREIGHSAEIARFLGVPHIRVEISALEDPFIKANPPDRCYHCKRVVFSRLMEKARTAGYPAFVHGANTDDRGDYRPGQKAADELGVRAPLLEADLGKEDIRALARARGLPNWDEPSLACLASRVPYGTALAKESLGRIDQAEDFLRSRFSLRQVRVRDHMPVARIELEESALSAVMDPLNRAEIDKKLKAMGWKYVTVDLRGFRTGSMNEVLK